MIIFSWAWLQMKDQIENFFFSLNFETLWLTGKKIQTVFWDEHFHNFRVEISKSFQNLYYWHDVKETTLRKIEFSMSELPKYLLKKWLFWYSSFCILLNWFRRINIRSYFSKFGKFNSESQLPLVKFTKLSFFDSKLVENSII